MGKPKYEDRTDLEKVQSQWHKLTGLHTREEWSAAVVRAATAAELAANFAIRNEYKKRSKFDAAFVDEMLRWANGLAGKMDRLLIPLSAGRAQQDKIKGLKKIAQEINTERNAIAHQGHFCSETTAKKVIEKARKFVQTLVHVYEPTFKLKDQKSE